MNAPLRVVEKASRLFDALEVRSADERAEEAMSLKRGRSGAGVPWDRGD